MSIPQTMRALICTHFYHDVTQNLEVRTVDVPTLGPGQVLVRVQYAGLDGTVLRTVRGEHPNRPVPRFIPGMTVAGEVVAVDRAVSGVHVGSLVFGRPGVCGAMAEYVTIAHENTWPLCGDYEGEPYNVEPEVAAAVEASYVTALYALNDRALIGEDEFVAVLGATGGVGLAAIDIARRNDATVVGIVGSQWKSGLASDVGVQLLLLDPEHPDSAIRRVMTAAEEAGHKGATIVVDTVSGRSFRSFTSKVLAPLARVCVIGFAGGIPDRREGELFEREPNLLLCSRASFQARDPLGYAESIAHILVGITDGSLKPVLAQPLPLERAVEGFVALAKREAFGHMAIKIG